jgi:hypothetical protein
MFLQTIKAGQTGARSEAMKESFVLDAGGDRHEGALVTRCTNDMFCRLAATGALIRVPASGAAALCPLCGKPLAPLHRAATGLAAGVPRFLQLLAVALVISFAVGAVIEVKLWWVPDAAVAAVHHIFSHATK